MTRTVISATATDDQRRPVEARRAYAAIEALAGKTPQQVGDWVETNVNDLRTAKDVLKLLAQAVVLLARFVDIEE